MITSIIESSLGFWQFFVILVILMAFLFPVLALISIIGNQFKGNDKLIWILVVLLLPFIGSILYFIIGRPKVKTAKKEKF